MTDHHPPSVFIVSADEPFARFRFAGGRFNSHTIPLEVLPDLAGYRRLVVEVAKVLFRQRMGTRVRVPKGFEDSFQIGLATVEGGSSVVAAMPRIEAVVSARTQRALTFAANQPDFNYPDFEDASRYIENVIESVGITGAVPSDFPIELAGFFNSFGQRLKDDEYIELGYGRSKPPVHYNSFIRKNIVLSREQTYENAVSDEFILNGGNVAAGMIHVVHSNGDSFDFRPATEFEFKEAYRRAPEKVMLVGTGVYDKSERLRRLLEVDLLFIDLGAKQPFENRLDEILTTENGWYDAENPAPSPRAVEQMRAFLREIISESSPKPYLYPVPQGGVTAEWSIGTWELSVEIGSDGLSAEFSAVDTSGSDERYGESSLTDVSAAGAEFMKLVSEIYERSEPNAD